MIILYWRDCLRYIQIICKIKERIAMKGKQIGLFCCTVVMAAVLLAGCGTSDDGAKASKPGDSAQTAVADLGKSKDGTYTAESSADDKLGKTDVRLPCGITRLPALSLRG